MLLTGTIVSPATRSIIGKWRERYRGLRHVTYDSVSCAAMRDANRASFGIASIPHYRFDRASLVVSFAADFLGTWLSPVEFARQYTAARQPRAAAGMSQHVQFEAALTLTGANADVRVPVDPSTEAVVAAELSVDCWATPRRRTISSGRARQSMRSSSIGWPISCGSSAGDRWW